MNNSPEIKLGLVANLFSRMMYFRNKGDTEIGHTHQFDHLTLLAAGSLDVTVDGVLSTFVAPTMIYISKDKIHELVAKEDNTVAYCIHALREDNKNNILLDPECIPSNITIPEMFKNKISDRILGDKEPKFSKLPNNYEKIDTYFL